jgi:hypothetical protein
VARVGQRFEAGSGDLPLAFLTSAERLFLNPSQRRGRFRQGLPFVLQQDDGKLLLKIFRTEVRWVEGQVRKIADSGSVESFLFEVGNISLEAIPQVDQLFPERIQFLFGHHDVTHSLKIGFPLGCQACQAHTTACAVPIR